MQLFTTLEFFIYHCRKYSIIDLSLHNIIVISFYILAPLGNGTPPKNRNEQFQRLCDMMYIGYLALRSTTQLRALPPS